MVITSPVRTDNATVSRYSHIDIPVRFEPVPSPSPSITDDQYYEGWDETESVSFKTAIHQGRILNSAYILYEGKGRYGQFLKQYELTPKESEHRRKMADLVDYINEKIDLLTNEIYTLYTSRGFSHLCSISQLFPKSLTDDEVDEWEQLLYLTITKSARQEKYNQDGFRPFGIAKVEQYYHQHWIEQSQLPEDIKEAQGSNIVSTAHVIELLKNLDKMQQSMEEQPEKFTLLQEKVFAQLAKRPGDATSLDDLVKQVAKDPKHIASTYTALSELEESDILMKAVDMEKLVDNAYQKDEVDGISKLTQAQKRLHDQATKMLNTAITLDQLFGRIYTGTSSPDKALRDCLENADDFMNQKIVRQIEANDRTFGIEIIIKRGI